jgi:hypothetical protein
MAAHYLLLELERAGYAKVLAMVADSSNTYSAPAMASVNKAFGRTGIPVGAYHGGVSSGSSNSAWAQPIAAQFGTADDVRSNYKDPKAQIDDPTSRFAISALRPACASDRTYTLVRLRLMSYAFSQTAAAKKGAPSGQLGIARRRYIRGGQATAKFSAASPHW